MGACGQKTDIGNIPTSWHAAKGKLVKGTVFQFGYLDPYMGVSKNMFFYPKTSILIGFSLINHPFWGFTPLFLQTPYIVFQLPSWCQPNATSWWFHPSEKYFREFALFFPRIGVKINRTLETTTYKVGPVTSYKWSYNPYK